MRWDDNSIIWKELVTAENGFPTKLYQFKSTPKAFPDYTSANQYLLQILTKYPHISIDPTFYAIAITWAEERPDKTHVRALDLKRYKLGNKFDDNPAVETANYRELEERPAEPNGLRETECETGNIVFGMEGMMRRNLPVQSLDEMLNSWPDYGAIETLDSRIGQPWVTKMP